MLETTLLVLAAWSACARSEPIGQTAPQRPKETDGNRLVKVELLADRSAIRAGETFELGVSLKVKPGWHIYWENPGDAGIPTTAEISAPEGFEIGAVRFPCPKRHESEGDIVNFVHEGDVLLLAEVKVPATWTAGTQAHFGVECAWLVCTDYCLVGSGTASLELPSAASGAPAAAANDKLFAQARARLPLPWKELPGGGSEPKLEPAADHQSFTVTLDVPGATALEYFPASSSDSKLVSRKRTQTSAGMRLELHFEQLTDANTFDYRGVLLLEDARGERSFLQPRSLPAPR